MCRSAARIFRMFLRHIEQGLRTRERNISETGVFKALVPWSMLNHNLKKCRNYDRVEIVDLDEKIFRAISLNSAK